MSRDEESEAFDCEDPPLSDSRRTDHRQLDVAEGTWEMFMPERKRQ